MEKRRHCYKKFGKSGRNPGILSNSCPKAKHSIRTQCPIIMPKGVLSAMCFQHSLS